MKVFLFSRRFLIPFLLTWILSLVYFGWKMWQLYKDDFNGKGLPASIKWEWLGYQVGGTILFIGFLSAFLVGISFYSHQFLKKDSRTYRPFARLPLSLVVVFFLVGFLFSSNFEPRSNYRGKQLLTDIVFYKSGSPFVRGTIDIKPPWCMTLSELFRKKKI